MDNLRTVVSTNSPPSHQEEKTHCDVRESCADKPLCTPSVLNDKPDYSDDWNADDNVDFWDGLNKSEIGLEEQSSSARQGDEDEDDDMKQYKLENHSRCLAQNVSSEKKALLDGSSQSVQGTTIPLSLPGNTNTFRPKNSTKSKSGIAFDDDSPGSSEDDAGLPIRSQNRQETSEEKYERIRTTNKRKLEQTKWISTDKMQTKIKKNSLFKR